MSSTNASTTGGVSVNVTPGDKETPSPLRAIPGSVMSQANILSSGDRTDLVTAACPKSDEALIPSCSSDKLGKVTSAESDGTPVTPSATVIKNSMSYSATKGNSGGNVTAGATGDTSDKVTGNGMLDSAESQVTIETNVTKSGNGSQVSKAGNCDGGSVRTKQDIDQTESDTREGVASITVMPSHEKIEIKGEKT